MYVHEIRDQLAILRMRKGGAHHAGSAVVQRRHGIEQMRKTTSATFERLQALLVGPQSMADLSANAFFYEESHELEVSWDFRSERDNLQGGE